MTAKRKGEAQKRSKTHQLFSYQDNPQHLVSSAAELDRLRAREEEATTSSERLADGVTHLAVACYSLDYTSSGLAWIAANQFFDFDPFPFQLLTMIVSLEAIFPSPLS